MLAGRAGTESETVGPFLEQVWLPSKEGRVEVSTYDQYEWAVRRHIVPLLGALRPRELRPTFRRPHYSVMPPALDEDVERLLRCENEPRINPYFDADEVQP